jgi:hypothetical protein
VDIHFEGWPHPSEHVSATPHIPVRHSGIFDIDQEYPSGALDILEIANVLAFFIFSEKETKMRATALIAIALLSLPAHADKASPFHQPSVQNEPIVVSVQPQPAPGHLAALEVPLGNSAPGCHRAQLSLEDISQMKSVQPSATAPMRPLVITGLSGHRAQLSPEDLSVIESVQPQGAVVALDIGLN